MSGARILVRGLTHRYPGADVDALADVSFEVEPGQRVGLLGPNGAGKSTLMRLLCGYLSCEGSGDLTVDGRSVRTQSLAVRERVGYMPEHVPLYPELRVAEHLRFRASIKHVPWRGRGAEVERVAELTGLRDRLRTPISQLSRGYRQRVGIADALLGSPGLLVLDEPTVGLDPNQVLEIRAMLRELGGSQTLVFSSHILAEVESLCDRVVILSQGSVVADDALGDVLAAGHVVVRLGLAEPEARALVERAWQGLSAEDSALPALKVLRTDAADRVEDTTLRLELPQGYGDAERLLDGLGRACAEAGAVVRTLAAGQTRLEERFATVTGARRPAEPTPGARSHLG